MTEIMMPGTSQPAANAGPRPMIVARDAHVTYRVFASGKRMTARESVFNVNALRGGRGLQTVHALRGVSFTASEGETIGVIGHNGSGKSTLFRAMSGLIPTSEGTILAADRPVLLGVNAALVPELSGENNIKLGLLAMGFTPEEAAAHVDGIADFAELNEFLYHPMRTYSSGMGARLRFAIASAKAHSILLVDEALAVGDRRFKLKSEQRIRELRDNAGLVMIVSHSVGSLRDTCERVLWIHKGELRADGPANDVIDEYVNWTKQPGDGAVGAAGSASSARAKRIARRAAEKRAAAAAAAQAASTTAASTTAASPTVAALRGAKAGPGEAPEVPAEVDTTPVAAAVPVAESREPATVPSPVEQLIADVTADVREIVVPTDSARTLARRDRFRRAERDRSRRRVVALVVAGVAVLLAVGAGAAIALLSNTAAPMDEPVQPGVTSESADAAPPVISGFTANTATVECATADGQALIQLSWQVDGATAIAVASGAAEVDAIDAPLEADLPLQGREREVAFPCSDESQVYTLTAANADGIRVSSTVTVTRALTTESEAPAEPEPEPAPQQPAPQPEPAPAPVETTAPETPAPVDTPAPVETPVPVETPEPVQTPAPVETPVPEASPAPEETQAP